MELSDSFVPVALIVQVAWDKVVMTVLLFA